MIQILANIQLKSADFLKICENIPILKQPPRGQGPQFFSTTVHIIVSAWVRSPNMPLLTMSHVLKCLLLAQTDWKLTFGGQNSLQEIRDLNFYLLLFILW